MKILVCGATGFVGQAITRRLIEAGHAVRALTRSPDAALHSLAAVDTLSEALRVGQLLPHRGDVTDVDTLATAVSGVDAVVQAAQFKGAPVERPGAGLTYEDVDHRGTVNVLSAITATAAHPHFVYASGITVDAQAAGPWNVAKWKAEEAVRLSGLPWTIVRSCWAYGPRDKALNRLLSYSNLLPFVPVFGDGQAALTPVFVEDIGRLFARIVDSPIESRDTLFRLGGPDLVTLDDFLRAALEHMGRHRPILHIPVPLGRLAALPLQLLPWRPLTPDAVDFVAQAGAVTDEDRCLLRERFPGFETTPLREGLASYLAR